MSSHYHTRTCRLLEVSINIEGTQEGCLEPADNLPMGCLVARSLNIVRQQWTKLELINVSDAELVIEPGQQLATFEPLCSLQSLSAEGLKPELDIESEKDLKVSLFDLEDTSLSITQKHLVKEFRRKHHQVIGKDEIDLGVTPTMEHEIDEQGSTPIKQRYRGFAPPMHSEIKIELEKLLRQGIIEPSMSPWASPLICPVANDTRLH